MQRSILFALLCILLFISLFFWQDVIELLAEEPRRAVISLEMRYTGNYLVPKINGVDYFNKPPLFNWIMAAGFRLFGSYQEWVVRFPSLLAWIVMAFVNLFFIKRFLGLQVALLSSLFTITAADVYYYGAIYSGEIDLFYSLIVYLQIISLFWFYFKRRIFWMFALSYTFVAIGFLTKGLPSIAFQGLTLAGMAFFDKRWRWLLSWKHAVGILFFILPAAFYYFLYAQEGDYLSYLINLVKEASQRTALESNAGDFVLSIFKFPFDLIKLLLPWSLFFVFLFQKSVKRIFLSNKILQFILLFVLFNVPIYWLTGELRNRYVYMFVPFFMIIIAYFYVNHKSDFPKWNHWLHMLFGMVLLLLPFLFLAPLFIEETRVLPNCLVKVIVLFLAGGICAYLYLFRLREDGLYILIAGMILLRLAVNWFYLPAYQHNDPNIYYEAEARRIVNLTGSEKIYFIGITMDYHPQLRLGPVNLGKLSFAYPEYIPFQLSYYIARENGNVLEFIEEPGSGLYAISREKYIRAWEHRELYRYYDRRAKETFVLVRLE